MEMPDGKQRQSHADRSEAALWYLRSKAKHLPTEEIREFASWLRRSPENVSALLSIATRDQPRITRRSSTNVLKQTLVRVLGKDSGQSREHTEHHSLSYRYLAHLKRKYLFPKLGLLAVTLCGVAGWMFIEDVRSLIIAAVTFAGFVLLWIREALIGLRVVNGYFGTKESEMRDFLKFITARYGDHADQKEQSALKKSALD